MTLCEGRSALRGPHSSNSQRHAALFEAASLRQFWVQLPGCSLDSSAVGIGVADTALLLCGVLPKSHGVDDRSPGQTRTSAQSEAEKD